VQEVQDKPTGWSGAKPLSPSGATANSLLGQFGAAGTGSPSPDSKAVLRVQGDALDRAFAAEEARRAPHIAAAKSSEEAEAGRQAARIAAEKMMAESIEKEEQAERKQVTTAAKRLARRQLSAADNAFFEEQHKTVQAFERRLRDIRKKRAKIVEQLHKHLQKLKKAKDKLVMQANRAAAKATAKALSEAQRAADMEEAVVTDIIAQHAAAMAELGQVGEVEFCDSAPAELLRLYGDSYHVGSPNGHCMLQWFGGLLPACQPGPNAVSFEVAFAWRLSDFCAWLCEQYKRLYSQARTIQVTNAGRAGSAAHHQLEAYGFARAIWQSTVLAARWKELCIEAGCPMNMLALLLLEENLHDLFMRMVNSGKTTVSWDTPAEWPAVSLASSAHASYCAGWIFGAERKKWSSLANGKSASESDRHAANIIRFAQWDPAAPDSHSKFRLQAPADYTDRVERKEGALYRVTNAAYQFVLAVERRAARWLTLHALYVHGGTTLVGKVIEQMMRDKEMAALFENVFPDNLCGIVGCPHEELQQALSVLRHSLVDRLMRSRGKVTPPPSSAESLQCIFVHLLTCQHGQIFTQQLVDDYKKKHKSQCATRQQMRAMQKKRKAPKEPKAPKARKKPRKQTATSPAGPRSAE
jgi:hypothetical protein